jgi:hypothetical protein
MVRYGHGFLSVTRVSILGRCCILLSHSDRVEFAVQPASSPHQLADMNSVARTFEAEKASSLSETVSEAKRSQLKQMSGRDV